MFTDEQTVDDSDSEHSRPVQNVRKDENNLSGNTTNGSTSPVIIDTKA